MKQDDLAARVRAGEYFHHLKMWPNAWAVIRCDGRSFSKFTAKNFQKPFDPAFRDHMITTASALMIDTGAVFGFTQSDEISVLLPPSWSEHGREWEKTVTLAAAVCSSAFSLSCGQIAHFDARLWMGASLEDVVDYFRWRQSDGERNSLNAWCYWALRHSGETARAATSVLDRLTTGEKHDMLLRRGLEFNSQPAWQRHGIGLWWETYEKAAVNPKAGVAVTATRRRLRVEQELVVGEELELLLTAHLAA